MERDAIDRHMHQTASAFEWYLQGIIITCPNMRIIEVNRAFADITGYTAQEAIGQNLLMVASGEHEGDFGDAIGAELLVNGCWQGEVKNRRKSGEIYTEWLVIKAIHDEFGKLTNYLGMFCDITEIRVNEERIARLAYYDSLTGLANRYLFEDRLTQAANAARRDGEWIAVMFIDLDGFKSVNDNFGHKAGDAMLQQVAGRLVKAARECDTVGRLGGDEFAVLLQGESRGIPGRDCAAHIARRFLDDLSEPCIVESREVTAGASIGISLFPDDGNDPDTLVRHADLAMYQAKREGNNCYRFFLPEMNIRAQQQHAIETDLTRALERHELDLHFQLQICIKIGDIAGAEVLVRWHHPEHGFVPPAAFIPVAENTGLIQSIGRWVLEETCRRARKWEDLLPLEFSFAVKLSPTQIKPGLDDVVRTALATTGVHPARIELEFTEEMIRDGGGLAAGLMESIAALGVRLSVEGFGTGSSSFTRLMHLPANQIKVVQSFLTALANAKHQANAVGTAIAMAHAIGLKVVIKGVETREQLDFLRAAGGDVCQGYLFSPPMPADGLLAFLNQRRSGFDKRPM